MLGEYQRALAAAVLQAPLAEPDVLDGVLDAPRDGDVVALPGQHLVGGVVHGLQGAVALLAVARGGLAHRRPQQHGIEEIRRHRPVRHDARVGVDHGLADHGQGEGIVVLQHLLGEGKEVAEELVFPQQLQGALGVAGEKEFQHLVEQARRRHAAHARGLGADGLAQLGGDAELQLGGEAHRAQHAHRVLGEAHRRLADHAQHALAQVLKPAGVVHHREIGDVVVQGVDGEVPPPGIALQVAIDVVAHQHALAVGVGHLLAVLVLGLPAEGGHLDDLAAEVDVGEAEAAADETAVAEQAPHLLGTGVGGDIEVLGVAAQQQVAHAAAHQVGRVARLVQAVEDLEGVFADVGAGNVVLVARDYYWRRVDGGRPVGGRLVPRC